MSKLHFTTKHANEATVQRNWYVVDGTNQTVGRMCSRIAAVLRGKNKAYYTPHVDCGDYVIVTNADKVKFTGNKTDEKLYQSFSGYPGGLREESARELLKRRPEAVVERAIKGMLPKNRLGRKMFKKLFVYAGPQHPHTAQQPKELKFKPPIPRKGIKNMLLAVAISSKALKQKWKNKNSVGRRKEAVTRVFISKGNGKITVNDKDYKEYFPLVYLQNQVEAPLKTIESLDKFDVLINATGGGVKGQAEAAKLGIARVLLELNPEYRPALKAAGLLKRDPRSVERKKFGHKKARRSYQFSKR